MCGGSSDRPSAAGEGQSANDGEGGSKTCGRHVVGSGAEVLRARNEEACRCGGVSAWGGDMRMDAGGRAGRARRRCRREWRKALRGAVVEGENRTEYTVVFIPVANREN